MIMEKRKKLNKNMKTDRKIKKLLLILIYEYLLNFFFDVVKWIDNVKINCIINYGSINCEQFHWIFIQRIIISKSNKLCTIDNLSLK